jgi:hypothetical protein
MDISLSNFSYRLYFKETTPVCGIYLLDREITICFLIEIFLPITIFPIMALAAHRNLMPFLRILSND